MDPLHTLTSCSPHVRHELHTSAWPRSEYYTWKSLERRIQSNSSHSIPTSLSLSFCFSFHFFFHNLQIRLLMAYAVAIKVTHTAWGSVCHQNSRLENKCAHTRDSAHPPICLSMFSQSEKHYTPWFTWYCWGKVLWGKKRSKRIIFYDRKSLFWLTGLGLLVMPWIRVSRFRSVWSGNWTALEND